MLSWISANLGTILITLALICVVAVIILNLKKRKKEGGSSCCGNCSQCGMCETYRKTNMQ